MKVYDVGEREEKIALFLVVKAMLSTKTQFFGGSGNAERLAGKSRAKDVVLRNIGDCNGVNVSVRLLTEISCVGFLRLLVPIRKKDIRNRRVQTRCESHQCRKINQQILVYDDGHCH